MLLTSDVDFIAVGRWLEKDSPRSKPRILFFNVRPAVGGSTQRKCSLLQGKVSEVSASDKLNTLKVKVLIMQYDPFQNN